MSIKNVITSSFVKSDIPRRIVSDMERLVDVSSAPAFISRALSEASTAIAKGEMLVKSSAQDVITRGMNRNAVNLARNVDGIADWAAENVDKYTFLYQSPLSGKAYLLDKVSTNKDGSVELKAYDRAKRFVKAISVQPKKLTIIDSFMGNYVDAVAYKMTHGKLVEFYANKNNPALIIDNYSIPSVNTMYSDEDFQIALKSVLKQLEKGRKIDAVCYSLGSSFSYSEFEKLTGRNISRMPKMQQAKAIQEAFRDINLARGEEDYKRVFSPGLLAGTDKDDNIDYFLEFVNQNIKESNIIDLIVNRGTRVITSAGNSGAETFDPILVLSKAEGVGGLSRQGRIYSRKIDDASSTRKFTQHYELADYQVRDVGGAFNISNSRSADYGIGTEFVNFDSFINGVDKANLLATEKQLQGVTDFKQLPEGFRKNAIFKLKDYYRLTHHNMSEHDLKMDLDSSYYYSGIVFSPKQTGGFDYGVADCLTGTSFAAPVRAAKILLYDSLKGILE